MAILNLSLSKLFRPGIEGRYANDPHDSGGETYAGVARLKHPDWAGWKILDEAKLRNEKLNGDALFARMLQTLQTFYRFQFWNAIYGDSFKDQPLADFLFACAVNMGVKQAIKLLQRAIGTPADGILGPRSMALLNSGSPDILGRFAENVRDFYEKAIAAHPEKARYRNGWMNRVAQYVKTDGSAVA